MHKSVKSKKITKIVFSLLLSLNPLYGENNNTKDSSSVVADEKGIRLIKRDNETTQNISISPDQNNITTQFDYTKNKSFSFNISSNTGINQDDDNTVLNIAFKALYTGAKLGTYIGVSKSSNMEKFIVSQGFKLKKGKIKLSGALLSKLSELNSDTNEFPDKVKLKQKSIGAEYSYDFFDKESLLQEIKTSIVYYDVDGKNIGNIDAIIAENNMMEHINSEYGNILGNNKISSTTTAVFRLSSNLKAIFGVTYTSNPFNSITADNEINPIESNSLGLKYRFSDYNQMSLYLSDDQRKNKVSRVKYSHNLRSSINTFLSAERHYNQTSINDNIFQCGISYKFGGDRKDSKLPRFFKEHKHIENLTLPEINPIDKVNIDNIM